MGFSVHAEVFDVDIAAEAGVEEQIPARVMVVVVNVDLIAVPLPVAAAVEIVRSHNPIRVVVEGYAAGVEVNAARDENLSHVIVAAVGIRVTGLDAGVLASQ